MEKIEPRAAWGFLKDKHYLGRKPQIMYAFGDSNCVITYGKPASNSLCEGVAGSKFKGNVIELNRIVNVGDTPTSKYISQSLKLLAKTGNWIVVSYADTQMGHTGKVYQATNFMYTGITKKRTDRYNPKGHSRHAEVLSKRVVRFPKHRYIYLVGDRKFKREVMNNLNYPVLEYPSGDTNRYTLGDFIKPVIVENT